jgi:hypothetical protein
MSVNMQALKRAQLLYEFGLQGFIQIIGSRLHCYFQLPSKLLNSLRRVYFMTHFIQRIPD